jgi:hypothetical protein
MNAIPTVNEVSVCCYSSSFCLCNGTVYIEGGKFFNFDRQKVTATCKKDHAKTRYLQCEPESIRDVIFFNVLQNPDQQE